MFDTEKDLWSRVFVNNARDPNLSGLKRTMIIPQHLKIGGTNGPPDMALKREIESKD